MERFFFLAQNLKSAYHNKKTTIMKAVKLLFGILITTITFSSCIQDYNPGDYNYNQPPVVQPISLEEVITEYDLWYVDYHSTTGTGDVPFMSMAFTISFINGRVYANNNLVDIGLTGNGYGVQTGYYDTFNTVLQIDHVIDGINDFEVIQVSNGLLKLYNRYNDVTYYLEGYQRDTFDYDQIFYDNIEYFLQEYYGWEKTFRSVTGGMNDFDYENYLAFTPENITTFYSSEDDFGRNIELVNWDYIGGYEVFDVQGYDNLKILTLDYDLGYNEEFELVVLNDGTIELYQYSSGTVYEFTGRQFIPLLRQSGESTGDDVRIEGRKRTKVQRKTKIRKQH